MCRLIDGDNLAGAGLVNADLSQTLLIDAVFTDANLEGTRFFEASFIDAMLLHTNWEEAFCVHIPGVRLLPCTESFLEEQGALLR